MKKRHADYYSQFSLSEYMSRGNAPPPSAPRPNAPRPEYSPPARTKRYAPVIYASPSSGTEAPHIPEIIEPPEFENGSAYLGADFSGGYAEITESDFPPHEQYYEYTDTDGRTYVFARELTRAADYGGARQHTHEYPRESDYEEPQPECIPEYAETPRTASRRASSVRKPARLKTVLSLLMIAVCLATAAVCTLILSAREKEDATVFPESVYFAVALGAFATQAEAEENALEIRKLGGAGYIVSDGRYLILAFAYASESDCESVISNLSGSGTFSEKYEISLRGMEFNDELNAEYAKKLLGYYESLYNAAVKLDRSEKTAAEILAEIITLNSRCQEDYERIPEDTYVRILLRAEYSSLLTQLSVIPASQELSASVKYAAIKVLLGLSDFLTAAQFV